MVESCLVLFPAASIPGRGGVVGPPGSHIRSHRKSFEEPRQPNQRTQRTCDPRPPCHDRGGGKRQATAGRVTLEMGVSSPSPTETRRRITGRELQDGVGTPPIDANGMGARWASRGRSLFGSRGREVSYG